MIQLHTTVGTISIQLSIREAPNTVRNFVEYVKSGHYEGTIFHRVIDGFMIQAGGFTPAMDQKPVRAKIENEAANGLKNKAYSVAMARTSEPHSATAQFFINLIDNPFLDHQSQSPKEYGYCVFGHVTEGFEVVDKIAKVTTETKGFYHDVPTQPIIIERVERVNEADDEVPDRIDPADQ